MKRILWLLISKKTIAAQVMIIFVVDVYFVNVNCLFKWAKPGLFLLIFVENKNMQNTTIEISDGKVCATGN